jgi:hypothetical protein
MKKAPFLMRYLLVLALLLGGAFGVHAWLRARAGAPTFGDLLPRSYGVNFLLAFGILAVLYALRHRMKHQLGFLFVGGSLLKFLAFFLLFYPAYTADETISRMEFASFLVPYFLALVTETGFGAALLRNLERENPG